MGMMTLDRSPSRSAADGDEIGRVETKLHSHLVHHRVWTMYRCLPLRGRVKLGPRSVGGQGVNDLQVVSLKHQERDLG